MIHSTENKTTIGRIVVLGVLVAALLVAMLAAAGQARAATTFTVTNTGDSGAGSLRQAIIDANNAPGADVIEFNISGDGVRTIAPPNGLPAITGPVTINGYSQPGSRPNTLAAGSDAVLNIEISGANASGYGLIVSAPDTTIKGLVVNRWSLAGVFLGAGATNARVEGNFVGTTPSGDQAAGNATYGVLIKDASGNSIGGATAAERNVISANNNGVYVEGAGSTGNRIKGNYIGTDDTGTKTLGNSAGVFIKEAGNTTVGGTTAGARNLVSGNNGPGVGIYGGGDNKVAGNYVGTDRSGTESLRNATGVLITASTNNTVGGTTAAERNVISGNANYGVYLASINASVATADNEVTGNFIGTDASGNKALGNDLGVYVSLASNNTIGGTTDGARNVISGNRHEGISIVAATGDEVVGNYVGTASGGTGRLGNGGDGVYLLSSSGTTIARNVITASGGDGVSVWDESSTMNRVLSNSIFANAGFGMDLRGAAGPEANDAGDADTGPNGLQNKPVLSSARIGSTTTTVRGRLNSAPGKTFTVQFFSNPIDTDEGKRLLGQKVVTTDAAGNVSFTFATSKKVTAGQRITATATGTEGTSEFATPKTAVAR